jgi:hypothetical protein
MRHISNVIKVEDFIKNRLKDRRAMLQASKLIDKFRKTYGKVEKGFDSAEIIRKMRDGRR